MGDWDTPPTAAELQWAPPTPEELGKKPKAKPSTGKLESGARGAGQGITLGFLDEAAGGLAAALPFLDREATSPGLSDLVKGDVQDTLGARYRRARDFYRARNRAAEESHPGTYLAGEVGGAVVPSLVGGAPVSTGRALLRAVGQGAAQGAGYSNARDIQQLASDTALGAAFGTAGYGAGKAVGSALSRLGSAGAARAALARGRAGSQAASEVADEIASARGALGAEVQKGSRQVENLMRLEESMTPEQRALYAQFQASGVVPNLQQSVAQSTLERLPEQAGQIAARQGQLGALTQGAPQAVSERARQLLTPQIGQDIKSFAKSYAEPLVWAGGVGLASDALGFDPKTSGLLGAAAGVVGGRTRAGKALYNRINRPAHQLTLGEAMQRIAAARTAEAARRALAVGAPAGLTASLVNEGD